MSARVRFAVRAVCAALTVAICMCALVSCSSKLKMTDDEAREILAEYLPRAAKLNEIVFGAGLPARDGSQRSDTDVGAEYFPVRSDCGYSSVAQLKEELEAVFSEAYLKNTIYVIAFDGAEPSEEDKDDGIRYSVDPVYRDIDGELCVNVARDGFSITTVPDASNAKVKKRTSEYVIVTIDYTNSEGESGKMDVYLRPASDGSGWRIDSATY